MAESIRLFRERLAETDPLTLELMINDVELRKRFVVEVVGRLYWDFRSFLQFETEFGHLSPSEAAAGWRPSREAARGPEPDDEAFHARDD
jgi:hypothetical protein